MEARIPKQGVSKATPLPQALGKGAFCLLQPWVAPDSLRLWLHIPLASASVFTWAPPCVSPPFYSLLRTLYRTQAHLTQDNLIQVICKDFSAEATFTGSEWTCVLGNHHPTFRSWKLGKTKAFSLRSHAVS